MNPSFATILSYVTKPIPLSISIALGLASMLLVSKISGWNTGLWIGWFVFTFSIFWITKIGILNRIVGKTELVNQYKSKFLQGFIAVPFLLISGILIFAFIVPETFFLWLAAVSSLAFVIYYPVVYMGLSGDIGSIRKQNLNVTNIDELLGMNQVDALTVSKSPEIVLEECIQASNKIDGLDKIECSYELGIVRITTKSDWYNSQNIIQIVVSEIEPNSTRVIVSSNPKDDSATLDNASNLECIKLVVNAVSNMQDNTLS
ncbi:MAG: hypothetical protein R3D26_20985 [Cyanobacteriota/Melainabacteria group bacterium]